MQKILVISILSLLISCSTSEENNFSLIGETKDIEDNTWFYLLDSYYNKVIDSVKVTDNKFNFKNKIDSFPTQVILHSKDYKNYNFFWLENKKTFFNASNSKFNEAIVSGSINKLDKSLRISLKNKNRKESLELEKQFIKENPTSIISAQALSIYTTTFSKKVTEILFNNFSTENKNSVYGKIISEYLTLNNGEIKIGDKFIDFELEDVNGNKKKLSEIKKNYILLEFWASNCGPCRLENPNLVNTYNKYKEKGFEIFAVSQDTEKQSWLNAIEKDKLPWIQVSDLNKTNKAFMIYDVSSIPDNFLIDKNGIIIAKNLRGEKLNKKLEELTNDKI